MLIPENSYAHKCSCGIEFLAPKGSVHCHKCLYKKIEQLERERDEFKETARQYTTLASKGIYHSLEELAQLKIEQQIKGIDAAIDAGIELECIENHIKPCGDIKRRAIEQLRKGGEL